VTLRKTIGLGALGLSAGVSFALWSGIGDRGVTIAQSVPSSITSPTQTQPNRAYVPLSDAVIAEMLKLAGVTRDDVVYSLGSGDGSLAIAAVKAYGARRSVGIEPTPELVQLSQTNAQQAGIGNRTQFLQQDLLQADVSEATVVNLDASPETALKLRSKLSDLKPGTRIVSRMASLGDWKPDKTITVPGTTSQTLYYWVVPQRIAGDWQGRVEYASGRSQPYTLRFTQQFQQVKGEAIADGKKYTIPNITLTGDHLTFSRSETVQGQQGVIQFDGHIEGDTLKGTAGVKWGILARNFPIVAQRSTTLQGRAIQ
jgi:precorrin-6B methylase 2